MSKLLKEDILKALEQVKDNELDKDVVSAGMVSSIVIRGNNVGFAIEVAINKSNDKEELRKRCEEVVQKVKGVERVTAVLTSLKEAGGHAPVKQEKRRYDNIPGVKNIVVVASGKGGVGKSTVAVNLAQYLADLGFKIGIVDTDVYGPSIPTMLGMSGKPKADNNNRIIPHENNGISSVSMGYFLEKKKAAIWRGPMVIKAMHQLFLNTAWKEIDYLIVDTPPGTGDVQLSLAKNFPLAGVVLVSTPQEVAIEDVSRSIDMFRSVNVPILGIIENMSYFEDPKSKNKTYIFGKDGVKKFAKKEKINFLGEIPIDVKMRENLDNGKRQKNAYLEEITNSIVKLVDSVNNFIKKVE